MKTSNKKKDRQTGGQAERKRDRDKHQEWKNRMERKREAMGKKGRERTESWTIGWRKVVETCV